MKRINPESLNFEINDSKKLNIDNDLNDKKIHLDKNILQKKSLDFDIKPDKEKSVVKKIIDEKVLNNEKINSKEINRGKIDSGIINNTKTNNDKINIENTIENKIFPKDDEMPELDEDIKNIDFTESEGSLPNSIQPLTDADIVNTYNSTNNI